MVTANKNNAGNAAAKKAAAEKAAAEKAAAEKAAAEKAAAEKAAAEKTAVEALQILRHTSPQAAAEKAAAGNEGAAIKIEKVPALSVTCSREGFRRGGRSWGKEASVVKLSELNDEQIAQIKGEALLTVAEVEVDEEVAV